MAGRITLFVTRLVLAAALLAALQTLAQKTPRSFVIDYKNNCFRKDGEPVQIVAGSIHSFRILPDQWEERLATMRAAGLNAIQTYVEWSSHEPEEGSFNFEGQENIVRFLKLAQKQDLLVLLRPGPYIDAERDMGGLPYWLLSVNASIGLRTSDAQFIEYVDRYFSTLLPLLRPLVYSNGGPIVAVQVENEYGSYHACDTAYMVHLRDLLRRYLGHDVVLYTVDNAVDKMLQCGKVDGAHATVDFGTAHGVEESFAMQRLHQERGPLLNAELYTGWLDHWAHPHHVINTSAVAGHLDKMLSMNASVSMYMFHGGTSFGFKSGANEDCGYEPTPTSYDYDAPMTEAGDPTDKFVVIRAVISKHLSLPSVPVPRPKAKMALPPIELNHMFGLTELRDMYAHLTTTSEIPLSFERIRQSQVLVLYDTRILFRPRKPGALRVPGLRDRGYIYVDDTYQGLLSRMDDVYETMISVTKGQRLTVLVESQGRNAFGNLNDAKGITANVTLSGVVLTHWNMTPIDDREHPKKRGEIFGKASRLTAKAKPRPVPTAGFGVYKAEFPVLLQSPLDSFLRLDNWRKGSAYLNGFNLGRYWTPMGPQKALYVPSVLFKPRNVLNVVELEQAPCGGDSNQCTAQFVDTPEINSTVPMHLTSYNCTP
ncbi:beta-galactosidase-like [Dermacentor variabilis]|uniref:beta-galactosidase-like n=1 Tax=Dermacentor variabilis TaxID=34621 RepID=UPI003F5C4B4D